MTLELQATPEEVMRAVDAAQQYGRGLGLAEKEVFHLAVAVEECGSNIVNHALQRDPRRKFEVAIEEQGEAVVLTFRDAGPEFDPTKAVLKQKADEEVPGGWGLELVRRFMDEIRYRREGGQNVLRLTKHLSSRTREK
jgi:serine/threonine-protein kinase RsbW